MNDDLLSDSKSLSLEINSRAVEALNYQRDQLKAFIKGQLSEGVDFGKIGGMPKPTLLKPGAEKLAKIFQLGSRIKNEEKEIDREHGFAMFTYTIEIFHLPTGKAISECQGSANSEEKKYRSNRHTIRVEDLLNTLQKMAQKRAYVGAIIMATGASDFFTQDVEDMPSELLGAKDEDTGELTEHYVVRYGQLKGKPLMDCDKEKLKKYCEWAKGVTAPKVLEDVKIVASYLRDPESFKTKLL
jgi:hypothetical protein